MERQTFSTMESFGLKPKGKHEILSVDSMFSVLSTPEKQQKKHVESVATGHGICEQDRSRMKDMPFFLSVLRIRDLDLFDLSF